MPRRKAINMETQYHPAYWRRVKNELEAHNTKAASIAFRKHILDKQKQGDYQREFEGIRGVLSHSSLPFQSVQRLEKRAMKLKELGASAFTIN